MPKTTAQLDREITDALRSRPRRHHATMSDSWDVAMDALLEHDPRRAAQIVRQIREEHGVRVLEPPKFSEAVRDAPVEVRQKLFAGREYSLPAFYQASTRDSRWWFMATEEMKKPGYKGLQVVWDAGDRKPKKAKQSSIQRMEISSGFYKQIAQYELPREVRARLEEA